MKAAGRAAPLALLVAMALPIPASAQKTVGDKAAAEALFDHGKQLLEQGRYAEACAKFAESQRLDAGVGTLLYLADCYEKVGQTASAWAGFREAAAAAKSAGQPEREKIARDRASALEPSLSKLTILVEPADVVGGVEVRRNGIPIGSALWGTPIPVDPGMHSITATAPGKKTWTSRVRIPANGASVTVNVPTLEDGPRSAGDKAGAPGGGSSGGGGTQRTAGIITGAVGLAGIGVGAAFGVVAMSKNADVDAHCRTDDPTRCDATGVALADDAKSAATVSTIAFGVGAAALVGGIVLFATAPRGRPTSSAASSARLFAAPTRGGGFVSAGGRF